LLLGVLRRRRSIGDLFRKVLHLPVQVLFARASRFGAGAHLLLRPLDLLRDIAAGDRARGFLQPPGGIALVLRQRLAAQTIQVLLQTGEPARS